MATFWAIAILWAVSTWLQVKHYRNKDLSELNPLTIELVFVAIYNQLRTLFIAAVVLAVVWAINHLVILMGTGVENGK